MKGVFFLLVLVTYFHIRKCYEPIPQLRVINGQVSGGLQHLFFAYIAFTDNNTLHCGGAIIKENVILTAAHCFVSTRRALQVYVGIHHVSQLNDSKPYAVKKKIPHPRYKKRYEDVYDIGLALLSENILLKDNIEIIPLAHATPPIGASVEVIGFGKEQCDYADYVCENKQSESLRFAFVKVIKEDDNGVIYTKGTNQNTCKGDSGGPVVYYGAVVGVVSTGEHLNCTGYDIHAPVALHYSWIQKYM